MKRLVKKNKNNLRQVRHARVRQTVIGKASCPRLSVWRGLKSITAQLIDDDQGATLATARSAEIKPAKVEGKKGKVTIAYLVGKLLAERAQAKGITSVVFDRGGYSYHGRVEALAEGARAGGLKF